MILVIQNGHYAISIDQYLDEEYIIVKSFETDVSNIDIDSYSIVIILGGHQSVSKLHLYKSLDGVINLIKKCIEVDKPLLGICLGCQLIAHALGCQIISSNKLNIGYDAKILGYDHIFRCHQDYVIPNDKIEVLAVCESMTYAFRYKKVFGIQCHPDVDPEQINHLETNDVVRKYAAEQKEIINVNNRALFKHILDELRSV